MYYSSNERGEKTLQNDEKIWGGMGVGKGSNFTLKFFENFQIVKKNRDNYEI